MCGGNIAGPQSGNLSIKKNNYDELIDEYHLCPLDDIGNPKYEFYFLYKNGCCFCKEFIDSLQQKSDIDELAELLAIMGKVDNNNLPQSKYRHITGGKRDRKDVYEFKTKHLRLYAIKKEPDYYLVVAGYKKGQDKDIAKVFRHFNYIPDRIAIKDESDEVEAGKDSGSDDVK